MQLQPKQYTDPFAAFAFLLFFAVLPFWNILSPIALALVFFTGLFLKKQSDFSKKIKANKSLFLLIAYFGLAVLSLVYTSNISESIIKCLKLTAFLFIPLAFLLVDPEIRLIEMAKKIFAYSCILFCVVSLLSLAYGYVAYSEISHYYNFVQRFLVGDYFPENAMFLNTAFVVILFGKFSNSWKFIGSGLFLILLLLYGVRLGLFIYLLVLSLYAFLNLKKLLNLKTIAIFFLGISISIFIITKNTYVNDKFFGSFSLVGVDLGPDFFKDSPVKAEEYHRIGLREKIWTAAMEISEKKPWIGYGAGVEKLELDKIYNAKNYRIDAKEGFNSHNQFLSTIVQFGVLGLIVLLTMFIVVIHSSYVQKNMVNGLIIAIMFISMLTESYLEIQRGLFYFCIFISLFIIEAKKKPIEN